MKSLKRNVGGMITCLFEVLVGILLLINPIGFTSGIIIVCGIVLLAAGILCIFHYFRKNALEAAKSQNLFKGLVCILAGGFCILKSSWILATFPMISVLYGIGVLLIGLGKVQWAVDMLRIKDKRWLLAALAAVISIVCGVIILNNPFSTIAALWMFTGIALIVDAFFDLFALLYTKKEEPVTEEA